MEGVGPGKDAGNPRAVLVALVAATGAGDDGLALCGQLLDRASQLLVNAPAEVISAAGGAADPVDRLAGIALLSTICGACRACARGRMLAGEKLGPVGRARKRRA